MNDVKKTEIIANELYKKIILKKKKLGIKTYKICSELDLEENLVANYFLGKSKDNLLLGVELLNYLEKKEFDL